jgi:hypothetical protein
MFLRKIFSSKNKFTWVIIDLCIVIIGVYCAFLIQAFAENQKTAREKEKILTALKYELEFFRIQMPGRGGYSENQANEWNALLDSGNYYNYSTWRFVEPQYNYQVLERAISDQYTEIIDFELYQALNQLYVQIRRIVYSERLLTDIALRYKSIPSNLKTGSSDYAIIWTENYDNFQRFVQFMYDRAGNQNRLGSESADALLLVNERLGALKRIEIEKKLIRSNLDQVKSEEEAVALASQLFPNIKSEEVRQLYREATNLTRSPVE